MIDAKTATKAALSYFTELYQGDYDSLAVEEIELSDDEKTWFITLGFVPSTIRNTLLSHSPERHYKLLTVSANDGKIIKMIIHKF